MKKIRVKNITTGEKSAIWTKHKKHTVFLGNNVTVYFSDLKSAKAFLAETNRFLNQKMFEINSIYTDLFSAYRKAWFHFYNTYNRSSQLISENIITNEIYQVERKFSLIVARSHYQNGSSIVWRGFYLIVDSFVIISKDMNERYRAKRNYAESHNINSLLSRINNLKKELDEWGKTMPEIEITD